MTTFIYPFPRRLTVVQDLQGKLVQNTGFSHPMWVRGYLAGSGGRGGGIPDWAGEGRGVAADSEQQCTSSGQVNGRAPVLRSEGRRLAAFPPSPCPLPGPFTH